MPTLVTSSTTTVTIAGDGQAFIADGVDVVVGGAGADALDLAAMTAEAFIVNEGTLVSFQADGVDFGTVGPVQLVNGAGGSIRGGLAGVRVSADSVANQFIINQGEIYGAFNGVVFVSSGGTAGTIRIENAGTITSLGTAVAASAFMNLRNDGTITGLNGVEFAASPFAFQTAVNRGTIDGATIGVITSTSSLVNLSNFGTIRGGQQAFATGAAIVAQGVMNLRNFGTIDGDIAFEAAGFNTLFTGGIVNGAVEMDFGDDVLRVFAGGTITQSVDLENGDDIVVNQGTIGGDVVMDDGNDRMTNHGTVFGRVDLGENDDVYVAVGPGVANGGVRGGAGEDTIIGADGADSLSGGSDDDILRGGGGVDTLFGGTENDSLLGGAGDDSLDGETGSDTLRGGTGADEMNGGADADLLLGEDGDDTIFGGTGDDTIRGGAGEDSIEGGDGANNMNGGLGNDVVVGGQNNDLIRGNDGNDVVSGADGADTVLGGEGNDTIVGGLGRDILNGGRGADEFRFASTAESGTGAARDLIQDFEAGIDTISLSPLPGVLTFLGSAAFTGTSAAVRLVEVAGGRSTLVQIDADGDGAADSEILLSFSTGITADDFLL